MGEEASGEIKAALAAVDAAIEAIMGLSSEQERVEALGRLAEELRGKFERTARLRHDEALAIYEAEKLSLGQLASRVGISKARAAQIVEAAKAKQDEGED